jgi:AraC-like DNA-binding protein
MTFLAKSYDERFFSRHPEARQIMELFEFLPSVYFYVKDAEHRYVCVNRPVLTEIFGMNRMEEILGKSDLEIQAPAMAEAYHAEDRQVMNGGNMIPNQVWLVMLAGGGPQWFVSTKTPLKGDKGDVIGLAGVMYRIDTPDEEVERFGEIHPVIKYLEEHYRSDISMEAMARLSGLSTTQFNKRFRDLLRVSPTELLLRLRIQEAQRLLVSTSDGVASIAEATGFCDQSHFTKRFKRVTDMTPLRYRKCFR